MAAGDIVRWISNSSTDWATGANWDGGSVPAAGEIVIFDGQGQADVAGGDFSSTFQLRAITVQKEYTGNIGTSGVPLIHNVNSQSSNKDAFLTIRGTGDFYWQAGGEGLGGDEDYSAVVDTAGAGTVSLDSDTSTGAALRIHVKRGNVTIAASLGGALTLAGKGANVTLLPHATSPNNINILNGLLTSTRALDLSGAVIVMSGGRWVQQANVTSSHIIIGAAARFEYEPSSEVTTGTTGLYLNGLLDLSKSKYAAGWSAFLRGPLARIVGQAKQGPVGLPGSAGLYMDLRDEYPDGT